MKIKGRTDPNKVALIRFLKGAAAENKAKIWAILASEMSKARRRRITVNLSRLNRISSPGDILLIPGKVLGTGSVNHQLDIAAESFSEAAQKKISNAGGKCLTIEELVERDPKGSQVRIIK
ncbi:MAG: 50S ribosomal protein L18e [Candidatus Heimdallarchaeota archaeon]|nr:MAG: 50S ribosomal protein L18e [Candidatus Heimdallarchaeota archaeon]